MSLALVGPVSTFRSRKRRTSRMADMSMLVLRRLEGQSRLLEEVIVLTVLELPRRYMLIRRNDGELLESVDWTKQRSTCLLGTKLVRT
jgi:hypothetical protein